MRRVENSTQGAVGERETPPPRRGLPAAPAWRGAEGVGGVGVGAAVVACGLGVVLVRVSGENWIEPGAKVAREHLQRAAKGGEGAGRDVGGVGAGAPVLDVSCGVVGVSVGG
jgi:hypothetical protein